jgi:sugar O-acyltransferase (sialic acid O-acetyltransferase NeuD family)
MDKTLVFILGAGGHSKVLIDCLSANKNITILGILDTNQQSYGKSILGVPVIGHEDEILKKHPPSSVKLINGIGSIKDTTNRKNIFIKFKNIGYDFLNVIHVTAYVSQDVILGEGVQIITRTTIHPGCSIGNNVIINTHASIDHDCNIADHVHIAPGVLCCGGVTIGKETHVGSGAVILQGIDIGDNCLIAAGSVVTHHIESNSKVAGVPARTIL